MFYAIVLGALAAASPEVTQGEAREILGKGYQTELPRAPTIEDVLEHAERERTAQARRDGRRVIGDRSSAPVTRMLLWVVIGGAAVLLLSFVISELRGRAGADGADVSAAEADGEAALLSQPLGDAEALAREGRFGEAIHALLLRTLAELARRVAVPTSLTSREILVQAELPGEAREALRSLVVAAEVSHFGGASPGRTDYEACAERFRAFVDAYRGVAAAA